MKKNEDNLIMEKIHWIQKQGDQICIIIIIFNLFMAVRSNFVFILIDLFLMSEWRVTRFQKNTFLYSVY